MRPKTTLAMPDALHPTSYDCLSTLPKETLAMLGDHQPTNAAAKVASEVIQVLLESSSSVSVRLDSSHPRLSLLNQTLKDPQNTHLLRLPSMRSTVWKSDSLFHHPLPHLQTNQAREAAGVHDAWWDAGQHIDGEVGLDGGELWVDKGLVWARVDGLEAVEQAEGVGLVLGGEDALDDVVLELHWEEGELVEGTWSHCGDV